MGAVFGVGPERLNMRANSIASFKPHLIFGFDHSAEVIPLDMEGFEDAQLQPHLWTVFWTVLSQHLVEILRGDLGFVTGFPHAFAELFPAKPAGFNLTAKNFGNTLTGYIERFSKAPYFFGQSFQEPLWKTWWFGGSAGGVEFDGFHGVGCVMV